MSVRKEFSAKGGKAGTGKAKARTPSQARAAAKARWRKVKRLFGARRSDPISATATTNHQ